MDDVKHLFPIEAKYYTMNMCKTNNAYLRFQIHLLLKNIVS